MPETGCLSLIRFPPLYLNYIFQTIGSRSLVRLEVKIKLVGSLRATQVQNTKGCSLSLVLGIKESYSAGQWWGEKRLQAIEFFFILLPISLIIYHLRFVRFYFFYYPKNLWRPYFNNLQKFTFSFYSKTVFWNIIKEKHISQVQEILLIG